jgi:hypothetical protein
VKTKSLKQQRLEAEVSATLNIAVWATFVAANRISDLKENYGGWERRYKKARKLTELLHEFHQEVERASRNGSEDLSIKK